MLGMEPYVHEAVRFWLNPPTQAKAQTQAQSTIAGDSGYQWKQVFLPAGTRLRASFGRAVYFATVEGDEIIHEGLAMSPSCFANLHGSGNRNAWRAVWLNFPGSAQWLLADTCRLLQIAAAQRLFEADQPAATTGEPLAKAPPAEARHKRLNRTSPPGAQPKSLTRAPGSRLPVAPLQSTVPTAAAPHIMTPGARAPLSGGNNSNNRSNGSNVSNGSRSRSRRRRAKKRAAVSDSKPRPGFQPKAYPKTD